MLDARSRNGRAVNVYFSLGMRKRYARLARRPDVLLSVRYGEIDLNGLGWDRPPERFAAARPASCASTSTR